MKKQNNRKNFISLKGKKIPCESKMINIFNLSFFYENPRIGSIIAQAKEKITDDFIDRKLWEDDNTHKLYKDVEKEGGLINPIVVEGNRVLEGNTRLCVYRHLYGNSSIEQKERWKYIPCTVLLQKLTKEQLYTLLSTEHITGKIEWNTYQKGLLLTRMLEEDKYDYEKIAGITKLSKNTIKNHIDAYKLMLRAKDTDERKFSYYVQLVSNGKIKKIAQNDPTIISKSVRAIKNGQFQDAREIRKIPLIYKHKISKRSFFENGASCEKVYIELKSAIPTVDSPLIRLIDEMIKKIEDLTREERNNYAQNGDFKFKIQKLGREVKKLIQEIK